MGEAKQRARTANDAKLIEASERERIAACLFFSNVSPEGRSDQRRYSRLFDDFDLDGADEVRVRTIKADDSGGVSLSVFSGELVEYQTTLDVLEYFLKATESKMPGPISRLVLGLAERAEALKAGTYTAPSQRVVEMTAPSAEDSKV